MLGIVSGLLAEVKHTDEAIVEASPTSKPSSTGGSIGIVVVAVVSTIEGCDMVICVGVSVG